MQLKTGVVIATIVFVLITSLTMLVAYSPDLTLSPLFIQTCDSGECFVNAMSSCTRGVLYAEEQDKAAWQYLIRGREGEVCTIEVTLLVAKNGPVGLASLEGQEMTCAYPLGSVETPGSDLTKCSGLLKEGLQEIMIKRLYQYVVGNLDEIKSQLSAFS